MLEVEFNLKWNMYQWVSVNIWKKEVEMNELSGMYRLGNEIEQVGDNGNGARVYI